jgi:hypothetical protein
MKHDIAGVRCGHTGAVHRSAAVLGIAGLCVLAGCASTPQAPIALPTPGSDPRDVLAVYLQALKAGDCRTAARLTVPSSFFVGNGELCGAVKVRSYTAPGPPGLPGNGEAIFSTTLNISGGDGSLNQGDNTWFYVLRQQSDGEWRLVGGGTGP